MNREPLSHWCILCTFICSIVVSGCDLINPAETIPSRIEMEPIDLIVDIGEGSDRHEITDIWVYADVNIIGVFPPASDISFLGSADQTTFSFRPGIRNNGIASEAIIYPMYTPYEITLPTKEGDVSNITPVTRYRPEVEFSLLSDFETSNPFTDNRDTVAASFVARSTNDPFEGSYSGEIVLSQEADFIEVGHAFAMGDLPTDGTSCYLEFWYKSEMEMSIGILGITLDGEEFSNFFYLVRPSENWNMLYIELTDFLESSDLPGYKILFRSLYPANATKPELKIYLDNIKVVHL